MRFFPEHPEISMALRLKREEAWLNASLERPYYPCSEGCCLEVNHDGRCLTHQQVRQQAYCPAVPHGNL